MKIVEEKPFSNGNKATVKCYGADDVREGVADMHHVSVDISITGKTTNQTRFQHPVAGTYEKECIEQGKKFFSVASGGGTGRTLHPDNMGAGPSSYGMKDTIGRMDSDERFAGSSSVPAHVEMMGLIGMGGGAVDIFNEKGVEVVVGARGEAKAAAAAYLQGTLKSTGSVYHEHQHHDEC